MRSLIPLIRGLLLVAGALGPHALDVGGPVRLLDRVLLRARPRLPILLIERLAHPLEFLLALVGHGHASCFCRLPDPRISASVRSSASIRSGASSGVGSTRFCALFFLWPLPWCA